MKKVAIIGAGVMGTIFLKVIQSMKGWQGISIADHRLIKLQALKKFSKVITTTDNIRASQSADLIILAVKPQSFLEVAKELKNNISEDCLIISIMAGVSIKKIRKELGIEKIIRAMPNLGAKLGKSMTVWTSAKKLVIDEKKIVKSLFDKIGASLYVNNEELIDKATAVSGSGPGFFFYIIERWLKAIEKFGFAKAESKLMLLVTIDAANELLQKEKDPETLKNQVTSKGGTTEAGLKMLDNCDFKKIWNKVLQAAYKRARQLSR